MKIVFYALVVIVMVWGVYIYGFVYDLEYINIFYYTISLFFGNIKSPGDLGITVELAGWWQNILVPGTLALIMLSWAVISLYLRLVGNSISRWRQINFGDRTLVIGLSDGNRAYIDNELEVGNSDIIVLEQNQNNVYIEQYKRKILVVVADANNKEVLRSFKVHKRKHIFISTGNDRKNISIAMMLAELPGKESKKIFVRIENRVLRVLFKQNIVKSDSHTDIIAYSLYENMTKAMFVNHSVLGKYRDITDTDEVFSTVVVGNSPLAEEVVYQLCMLTTLPNENRFNLYLLSPDATEFYARLQKLFAGIDSIPHLTIEPMNISYDSLAFYQNEVWRTRNLTNIIIVTEDEEKNLDIAINLQDTTYTKSSIHKTLKSKILFAIHNRLGLGEKIDKDTGVFANFYTFADIREATTPENLIDEKLDTVSKWANFFYAKMYDDEAKSPEKVWTNTAINDKLSTRAQVSHISTKLTVIGLDYQKSTSSDDKLLSYNRNLFHENLNTKQYGDTPIDSFKIEDYPKEFTSAIDKLARSEHNRWNAFHYLHGWVYSSEKNKPIKEHDCLLPLEEFITVEQKESYAHDLTSVTNIPLYLAQAGYELVELNDA